MPPGGAVGYSEASVPGPMRGEKWMSWDPSQDEKFLNKETTVESDENKHMEEDSKEEDNHEKKDNVQLKFFTDEQKQEGKHMFSKLLLVPH